MNSHDNIVKSIGRLSEEIRYGAKATFVEILMRRAIAPLLSNIYRLEKEPKLLDELLSLIESNRSFLILMLLSARFEFFREAIKYVNMEGKLKRVVAPSSYSYKWLPKLFRRHDVRILFPYLNVGVHNTLKIFGSLTNAILIRDNSPLRTTSPSSINRYIFKNGLGKRNIIIYAQPHFPWLSDAQLSQQLYQYVAVHELLPGDIVRIALRRLKISRKRVLKAYYLDLLTALKCINEVIEYAKTCTNFDKVVVTGIHGELLGEFGFYFHKDLAIPQLVLVPWYEVSA